MHPELLRQLFTILAFWMFVLIMAVGAVTVVVHNRRLRDNPGRPLRFRWVPLIAALATLGFWGVANLRGPALYQTTGWARYTAEDNAFSIQFPGEPDVDSATAESDDHGPVMSSVYGVHGGWAGVSFLVHRFDYPADAFADQTAEEIVAEQRAKLMEKWQQTIERTDDLLLDGHPGAEVVYREARGFGVTQVRFYVVDHRVYVLVGGPFIRTGNDPSATKFFESFTLNPAPETTGVVKE